MYLYNFKCEFGGWHLTISSYILIQYNFVVCSKFIFIFNDDDVDDDTRIVERKKGDVVVELI